MNLDDVVSDMLGARDMASSPKEKQAAPTRLSVSFLAIQTVLFGLALAFYLMTISFWSQRPASSDFTKFYAAARYLAVGEDIYAVVRAPAAEHSSSGFRSDRAPLHPNLNPPFQTLVFAPLGMLDYGHAFWVWALVSLACGLLATAIVARTCTPPGSTADARRRTSRVLWLWIALLVYLPTWISVCWGQLSLVVFLLLAIGWAASRRERHALAGAALGLAFGLKVFVGLFGLLFALRRRWRALASLLGTAAACALVALVAVGPVVYARYVEVLAGVDWYADGWNASLLGFFSRIFGGTAHAPLLDWPSLGHALTIGAAAIVAWLTFWPRRDRPATPAPTDYDLAYGQTTVAMLLLSPLAGMYYFPALQIPFAVAWDAAGSGPSPARYRASLAGAWLLSNLPVLPATVGLGEPLVCLLRSATPTYALLLLFGILVLQRRCIFMRVVL